MLLQNQLCSSIRRGMYTDERKCTWRIELNLQKAREKICRVFKKSLAKKLHARIGEFRFFEYYNIEIELSRVRKLS